MCLFLHALQVAALTRLQQLTLQDAQFESSGHAALAALHSLRHLRLDGCFSLPSNLSELTWLEAFSLQNDDDQMQEGSSQTLLSALPQLTRLTYLALDSMKGLESPPAALAGLTHLHTFVWLDAISPQLEGSDAALPGGPWLGSLRRLAAPAQLLANSLPLLAGPPRLEHLGVTSFHRSAAATCRLLRTALYWSSLQKVSLLHCPGLLDDTISLPPALVAAALEAQRQRPSLLIDLSHFILANLWLDSEFVD